MNRRRFLSIGMGVVAAAGMGGVTANPGEPKAWADDAPTEDGAASDALGRRNGSVNRAYDYLSFAMDAYQQGETPRLVQSYSDSQGLGSTALWNLPFTPASSAVAGSCNYNSSPPAPMFCAAPAPPLICGK